MNQTPGLQPGLIWEVFLLNILQIPLSLMLTFTCSP